MKMSASAKRITLSRIKDYKRYDKSRFGTVATITYAEYLEMFISQDGLDYWTGRPMTINDGTLTEASLDRVDCNKPHTADNSVLCRRTNNLGRSNTPVMIWLLFLHDEGTLSQALTDKYFV